MPTNIYGPGDNYDLENSHVLPALIRRFHEAKIKNLESVALWGSGSPKREFLHSYDLASACLFLLENYDGDIAINVGTGNDLSIMDLALLIREIVGFAGDIDWDASKPDGTPRKLLDVSRISNLGWHPKIDLKTGISMTYESFLKEFNQGMRNEQ
jgi:GDP-L-fucose synthase